MEAKKLSTLIDYTSQFNDRPGKFRKPKYNEESSTENSESESEILSTKKTLHEL